MNSFLLFHDKYHKTRAAQESRSGIYLNKGTMAAENDSFLDL